MLLGQGPVPDTDSDDPPVERETEVEEMNSTTIESDQNGYEQEHQHHQKQTHEMREQRQQKRQQQHQQEQQQPVDPSNSMGDRRMVTVYIRRIPTDTQIKDVQQLIQRQQGIAGEDLHITQTVPNVEFRGRWKFMRCEGPRAVVQLLSKACDDGRLHWKMSSSPPTCPKPFWGTIQHKEEGSTQLHSPHLSNHCQLWQLHLFPNLILIPTSIPLPTIHSLCKVLHLSQHRCIPGTNSRSGHNCGGPFRSWGGCLGTLWLPPTHWG